MADAPKSLGQRALKVIAIVIGLFAFVVGKQFVQIWHEQRSEQEQAAKVATQMDKLRAEAIKEQPGVPVDTAMEKLATEQAEAKLATLSGAKKSELAAGLYFGFFAMNTKARPAFCKEQGVDIPVWTAAFEKVNAPETARTRLIFANIGFDENHGYAPVAAQLKKFVTDDMTQIATEYKMSLPDACKLLQSRADEFAARMSFADLEPVVYKALMVP